MTRPSAPFTLELSLLGILARTPMHGYNLFKAVAALDGFGLIWKVKQASLYALLVKLEARGLVRGTPVPGENHPSRREFRVTPEGQAALDHWRSTPVERIRSMRQDFFARLFFAREAGPGAARELLLRQRDACRLWRQDILRRLEPGPEVGEYSRVVLGHRLCIVEASLAWLDGQLAGAD